MLTAFIHGLILAIGLIIPLGVQNIFIFNQGAMQPKLAMALPSVLTAFVCDTILISLAVLGLSLLVLELAWLKTIIFALGFCFLMYMGWLTWHKPTSTSQPARPLSAKRQILFAASVSLLNPHAILDSMAVIGTNSLNYMGNAKLAFASACILTSLVWFVSITICGKIIHRADTTGTWLVWINKLSAIIMWSIALYMAWQLVGELYAA